MSCDIKAPVQEGLPGGGNVFVSLCCSGQMDQTDGRTDGQDGRTGRTARGTDEQTPKTLIINVLFTIFHPFVPTVKIFSLHPHAKTLLSCVSYILTLQGHPMSNLKMPM